MEGVDLIAPSVTPPVPWALRSRWRLFTTLTLTLVILMGALAFSMSGQVRRSLEAEAIRHNRVVARFVARAVEERFAGLARPLESLARDPNMTVMVERRDAAGLRATLRQFVTQNPEIDRAFIADPAGVLRYDYPPVPAVRGRSFAERDWYRGVSAARKTYVSETYTRAAPPQVSLVAIATPLRNAWHGTVAYLVAQHTIDALTGWVAEVRPSTLGAVTLIDQRGVLATGVSASTPPVALGAHALVRRALAGEAGSVVTADPLTGEPALITFDPVPSISWAVLTRRPLSDIAAPLRPLERTLAVLTLVCLAVMLGLGLVWFSSVQRHHRALEETNRTLERTVGERRRAEEAAAAANRAKSEFLSRMSHELRTPLNGILGFAQLLELDAQSPQQRESVEHILKGGRHLLVLINEVLDIARIEAGRLSISLEPVLASDVIRSALDLVRPQAAARGVRLPETVDCGRHVMADRQRLQQVLLNLLSNAVKYNRETGAVSIACDDAPSGRLRLTVADTGPGIPPEGMRRLFTPFDRLGAQDAGVEGTGLGLALSKGLVELMGGTLWAESTVGEGSRFTVELPLAESPTTELEPAKDDFAQASAVPGVRGKVLYIEDNLSNLRLVERIVTRRPGVTLLSAMQGSRGLELAQDHRPDLIVLDLHLPDLPGHEVLARLRADPRTGAIPVVILSADATPGQVARLLQQGAHAYLTKPFEVPQLLALLDELLVKAAR